MAAGSSCKPTSPCIGIASALWIDIFINGGRQREGNRGIVNGLRKRGSWLHRPCLYLSWHCFKEQPNILITVRSSAVVGVTVCLSSAFHFYKYTKLGLSMFKNIPLCAAERYLHRCSDRGTDTSWNSYELPFLERCVWSVSSLKNAENPFSIFHHFQPVFIIVPLSFCHQLWLFMLVSGQTDVCFSIAVQEGNHLTRSFHQGPAKGVRAFSDFMIITSSVVLGSMIQWQMRGLKKKKKKSWNNIIHGGH